MKAIETTATFDDEQRLTLNQTVEVTKGQQVRVIILIPEAQEISETQWLKAASTSDSFSFLDNEPDLYSLEDGNPFNS